MNLVQEVRDFLHFINDDPVLKIFGDHLNNSVRSLKELKENLAIEEIDEETSWDFRSKPRGLPCSSGAK
jgi:hypothetical protein